MIRALIDTGPILAFFDESDRYCRPFREYLRGFSGTLFTSVAVITEVSYLLEGYKLVQLAFLEWIRDGAIAVENLDGDDFFRIHRLMKKYSDTPMDFADATLMAIAEKKNIFEILTFDSDFSVYRIGRGKSLSNPIAHVRKGKK